MSRLPIRWRLTLAFAGIMAIVLAAVGAFLYLQLESNLDESVDQGLRSRATETSALYQGAGGGGLGNRDSALIERDESFAQVLTPDGAVLDSTPQLGREPVIGGEDLRRAATGPVFLERDAVPGIEGTARLLAVPVERGGSEAIVVVGSSLGDRDEAVDNLASLLLIGGPAALLLAAAAAYWLTGSALRPVEAMRRRASEISAHSPGERLPVSEARDELSRLGDTLNEMLTRLEEALQRERRFVDDASHELRTPLALHRAELEVALKYEGGEEELRAAVASAGEEIDKLIALAEDLLVLARSSNGVPAETVPVRPLLAKVAERLGPAAERGGRELRVSADGEYSVRGDATRLERALANLVDNALRHGEGAVELSATGDDGSVQVHVSDEGSGFPGEFLPRAFERFSRADQARSGAGTGLGLAIAAAIAEGHGGRAGAANRPDGGADVWIELPAA
jgi:two-component system OmpR family sensor kinase